MTSVAADGKVREMTFIDRRTFTMWLATIGPCLAGPRGIRVAAIETDREAPTSHQEREENCGKHRTDAVPLRG